MTASRQVGQSLPDQVKVLIVGAGPAGMVAGITLAGYGIDVLLVEKRAQASALSRAMLISTRTMELMRRWGLEAAIRAKASDVEAYTYVTESLTAGTGSELPMAIPTRAEAAVISPTQPAWAPQDDMESVLLAHLRTMPTAAVRLGCELTGLRQDDNGVRATLLDLRTETTHLLEARYVIGADGPYSTVRKQLGIAMEGLDHLGDYESVQFRASLDAVAGDRKPAIYMITRPDAAGFLSRRGHGDRWVFARTRAPGQAGLADLEEAELAGLLARAAGIAALRPRIERFSTFALAALLAERYREGRGFLIGDAAHRMTPRGGTGMNTAIQDAFDLGWKLAWVLRGWAPADLLDSYQTERRPVGRHNVEFSSAPPTEPATAAETLPWDLNGRLAHRWLPAPDGGSAPADPVCTLDLVGDGLTLLAGPAGQPWTDAGAIATAPIPLTAHMLDEGTADALGLQPGGAMLVRPDCQEIRRWSHYDEADPPRVDHLSPAAHALALD
ncbi:FAD-dependent monooxygenase [Streptomyces sp. NK08204]|uniref:FAD-dependent monooxygenase n=1 Tax=Streptomyces sp. NK08204 TaxID=2873260 RepID=UPI001CED1E89|nr:FAD-dependent monooxygenase [Streptomyces sp. NK08204]